ncbi:MAG: Ig-like domain-containing protein, partial [Bacteroidales bacterium]|nr:Ig-like domain-containing protein [Bacteroidales bacterium]
MAVWKRKCLYFYPVILTVLFASCAQQATLTGGEQDISPPVILNQEPPNYTTAFNSPQIHIHFDEYVELVNPSESFLFSPPLPNPPEYTLKGKSLIIDLKNELEKNTTYIITCNQGIKDLTEGNFLPVTTFVYSTGDYIDSLSLFGTVIDAYTMLPEEKAGVMLYKQYEDSALLKNLPYYYTTTRTDGTFLFSNIAEGEYQLYALVDKNRNYLFDQSDEKVAFSNNLVQSVYIPPVKQTDTTFISDSSNILSADTSFHKDSSKISSTDTSFLKDSSNISSADTSFPKDSSKIISSTDTSFLKDSSNISSVDTLFHKDSSKISSTDTSFLKDSSNIASVDTLFHKDSSKISSTDTSF